MYQVLLKAGFTLVSLGFLVYTAWKTKKLLDSRTVNNVVNFAHDSITKCAVCLEEFTFCLRNEVLDLPCKHKFHKECISEVFKHEAQGGRRCPFCRRTVTEEFIRNSRMSFP